MRNARKIDVVVLVAVGVVGLVRGLFWVVATEVWNPIDEAHHYAYVESLATGKGIPVVGKDRVSKSVLDIAKRSPTLGFRAKPVRVDVDDPSWGAYREQYEGVQGPTYYALLVPAYWVSRPYGTLASIYGLRTMSLLIALLAVPLAYLLSRELFPKRPAVWLGAPLALVTVQGFNFNLTSVTNDALVVPLSVAAMLPIARGSRTGLTSAQALTCGALVGACVVTKTTTTALFPLIAVALLVLVGSRREHLATVLKWGALFAAAAAAVLAPWIAWNLLHYDALSASSAVHELTGRGQSHYPLSVDGLRKHLGKARLGFWDLQRSSAELTTYIRLFEFAAVCALAVGVAGAIRRRTNEGLRLLLLAAAHPLSFAMMAAIVYVVFGGVNTIVGRHLYIALVPLCIILVAGPVLAWGDRAGLIAAIAVLATAVNLEPAVTRAYADPVFAKDVLGPGLIPLVEQLWNDEFVPTAAVSVHPPCHVPIFGLLTEDAPPEVLMVREGQTNRIGSRISLQENLGIYQLDVPARSPFEIVVPTGLKAGSSITERNESAAFVDRPGDPTLQLYCQVENPHDERFLQRYAPLHPSFFTRPRIQLWSAIWAWLARIALVGLFVEAIAASRRRLLARSAKRSRETMPTSTKP